MLGEESAEEDNPGNKSSNNLNLGDEAPQDVFDSYHVLMKEVGVDGTDGLSQAFL